VQSLQVSKFKARCLGLLREIRDTGEPLLITLRGEKLAVVVPPDGGGGENRESVAETLRRLRPLLLAEDEDLEIPPRSEARPSSLDPFGEND